MDRKGEHFKVRCLEKWQADICFSAWLVVERWDWQLDSQNRLAGWERRWQGSSLSRHLSWQLAHMCVFVCVSVQVYVFFSTSLKVCRRVYLCALCACFAVSVCFQGACARSPVCVCVCLPVSLHKRRLSWQLAALLGNCFAKFRLLLSNIQTPPNHQPAKRPGLCLMPATPSSPLLKLQSPSLLQAPRSVPRLPHSSFLAQRVLGSLHSVSCGCLWLWSQVNQGWRFAD